MYQKWDALRNEVEGVKLEPHKNIEDRYIPRPPRRSKGGKGKGGRGFVET